MAGRVGELSVYTDSNQIGSWSSEALRTAIHSGLVKGYGDELRPRKSLTRAEMTCCCKRDSSIDKNM
ncbi:S-layer homology domain-containing protein [Paenibacillus tyrfis]|uniref:S-layer homology domain-containing protein n=1 Tax=Paenibacillus tyrfis TaxID=1501230 RepID=UPI0038992471